jgi:hypothetical protein
MADGGAATEVTATVSPSSSSSSAQDVLAQAPRSVSTAAANDLMDVTAALPPGAPGAAEDASTTSSPAPEPPKPSLNPLADPSKLMDGIMGFFKR